MTHMFCSEVQGERAVDAAGRQATHDGMGQWRAKATPSKVVPTVLATMELSVASSCLWGMERCGFKALNANHLMSAYPPKMLYDNQRY